MAKKRAALVLGFVENVKDADDVLLHSRRGDCSPISSCDVNGITTLSPVAIEKSGGTHRAEPTASETV